VPKGESHGSSSDSGAGDLAGPAHPAGPGGAPGSADPGASHIGSSQPVDAHPPAPVGLDRPAHDSPPNAPAEEGKPTPEKKLNTAIKENTPDVTAVPYRQLYTVENEKERKPIDHGPAAPYTAVGLDPEARYTERDLIADPNAPRGYRVVLLVGCSTDEKAINVISSYKRHDNLGENSLPWSELTFQQWREKAGARVAELKWVARQHVVNEETQKAMAAAHERVGIAKDARGVFYPGAAANSPMAISWDQLTKTVNAKGVFYMLADHHRELRDLKVVKIHTWLEFRGQWASMVLELGH